MLSDFYYPPVEVLEVSNNTVRKQGLVEHISYTEEERVREIRDFPSFCPSLRTSSMPGTQLQL
jgi:uncharacterized membrane protein